MRIVTLSLVLVAATAAASPHGHRHATHHHRHHHHHHRAIHLELTADDAHDAHLVADDRPLAPRDEPVHADRARPTRAAFATDDAAPDEVDAHVAPPPPHRPRAHHHHWYIRGGGAYIMPRIQSGTPQLQPSPIVSVGLPSTLPTGGIVTDNVTILAGVIGYAPEALHGYVSFETLFGVPTATRFRLTGELATQPLAPTALGVPTGVPALGTDLGEAMAVPPTATVTFRAPPLGPVTAYVGTGASMLFITNVKITNPVLSAVGQPKVSFSPTFGVVAQAGLDIHLFDDVYARFDVKELWFQPTHATISDIKIHTTIPLLESIDIGTIKATANANPLIFQGGVGFDF